MIDTEKRYKELVVKRVSLIDIQNALTAFFTNKLNKKLKNYLLKHNNQIGKIGFCNGKLAISLGLKKLDFARNLSQLSNNFNTSTDTDIITKIIDNYFKTYTQEDMINFVILQSVYIYFDSQTKNVINNWVINNFFNMEKFMAMVYVRKFCLLPFMLYCIEDDHYQLLKSSVTKDREWLDVLSAIYDLTDNEELVKNVDIPWSKYHFSLEDEEHLKQYNNQINELYLKQLVKINCKVCPKYVSSYLLLDAIFAAKNNLIISLPCSYLNLCMQADDKTDIEDPASNSFTPYSLIFQIASLYDVEILYKLIILYKSWYLDKYLTKNRIQFTVADKYAHQFNSIIIKLEELEKLTGSKYIKYQIGGLHVFQHYFINYEL